MGAAQAESDVAYLRVKTEVAVNHEEHRYRMQPKNIRKVKSIVNYHWSPKKRRQMQKKINRVTEPIENQTLDEVWETIRARKESKLDVSDVLGRLNLSRSYQAVIEETPETKKKSPTRAQRFPREEVKVVTEEVAPAPEPQTYEVHEVRSSPPPPEPQEIRSSPPAQTSPPAGQVLSTQNVEKKDWSFEADSDILTKELELGKDLLVKASDKIDEAYLKSLSDSANTNLIDQEKELVIIFLNILDLVNEGTYSADLTWDQASEKIQNQANTVHKIKNFAVLVENQRVNAGDVIDIKNRFISASPPAENASGQADPIRDFLCEFFCLVDIVEELRIGTSPEKLRSPARGAAANGAQDTSLQDFKSPAGTREGVGIDPSMISPIPNRGEQDLGGQSVNRYMEMSAQDVSGTLRSSPQRVTTITTVKRSPGKGSPKRHQQYLNVSMTQEERKASASPARDLARKMQQDGAKQAKKKAKQTQKKQKVRSPTKRLRQMKDAKLANAQKQAARGDGHNKMLYTVSPKEGYLVNKEYHPEMDAGDMTRVEREIAERISTFVTSGKEFIGKGKDPRRDIVQQVHENIEVVRASPSKIITTEITHHVPPGTELTAQQ